MFFDPNHYNEEKIESNGSEFLIRAFRNLVFADHPVEDFHIMNLYVPEAYYDGKSINGYTLNTAPVFLPNAVGGYCPSHCEEPSDSDTIRKALAHGFVVASPAIRGRTSQDENGKNIGKAPACIVDYKAAVRYLHRFADELPGDEGKIITNGTSAGGALSCLAGVTGNHPDYGEALREIGAADGDDSAFAASCYCPITNLDHADMAYEWEFDGVCDYHRKEMHMEEGGRPVFTTKDGVMDETRIGISKDLSAMFPAYVNSLSLKDENGKTLTLDENGNGSFKEYVESVILRSAGQALEQGKDLSDKKWLVVKNKKAVSMNFADYAREITRMKMAPAFDDVAMTSPENHLFGDADHDFAHFTAYSMAHSQTEGRFADEKVIKMLNPMNYIGDKKADTAKYFRIRHGECDRDTSLAVSAILNLKLTEAGCVVDYASPWNVPHSGDYDLDELFAWIDGIAAK